MWDEIKKSLEEKKINLKRGGEEEGLEDAAADDADDGQSPWPLSP